MPSTDGATSAWISTSTGRVPSMPANTAAPLTGARSALTLFVERIGAMTAAEEQRRRVRHLDQAAVGHLEDADLVGRRQSGS